MPNYELPLCCPGCGAYSQTIDPNEPGYYDEGRKQVRKHRAAVNRASENKRDSQDTKDTEDKQETQEQTGDSKEKAETAARDIQLALANSRKTGKQPRLSSVYSPYHSLGLSLHVLSEDRTLEKARTTAADYLVQSTPTTPICNRCHDLMHHNAAASAPSPTLSAIRELLNESPHRDNHIYHIMDAVDFPMSLASGIYKALNVQEQRSRNRRATVDQYKGGRKLPDITFVITRADLLAPEESLVDSKMEYMRSVLRDALGKWAADIRMGNVHMISCWRGWRSKQVKEQIREQRGGVWVIGKTNVGKSHFIETCFPKDSRNLEKIADLVERRGGEPSNFIQEEDLALDPDAGGLLPPAPREGLFPVFPVVSSLSGTTVSPIRIPFGRGRGEMIDLPGLERDGLEPYVVDRHKRDVWMTHYVRDPLRCTITGGRSLLLAGGLVRITSVHPDDVLLAACFVPFDSHVTRTDKAVQMQRQETPYPKTEIMKEGVGETILSAGIFDLKWDITQDNLPTALSKAIEDNRATMPALPYKVFGADILIEGAGWIELSAQVRTKETELTGGIPQVEVFTPNGRHVGLRAPIQCYKFVQQRKKKKEKKLKR